MRRRTRKVSKRKGKSKQRGGFYPSVYSGVRMAGLLSFAAARQGYKLLKNYKKTRKSKK